MCDGQLSDFLKMGWRHLASGRVLAWYVQGPELSVQKKKKKKNQSLESSHL
jgi:hypothetical protein